MDMLIWLQRATQQIRHDRAVLSDVAAFVSIRMIWAPYQPVATVFNAPAAPTGLFWPAHRAPLRRLSPVSRMATGAATKYTPNDGGWLSFNRGATSSTSVSGFHIRMIPQTSIYVNAGKLSIGG
jgi:hypothetical protein